MKGGITGVRLQIFQGSASARHRALQGGEREGSLHGLNQHLQAVLYTPNHPSPEEATGFGGKKGGRGAAAGRIATTVYAPIALSGKQAAHSHARGEPVPAGHKQGSHLGNSSPIAAQP